MGLLVVPIILWLYPLFRWHVTAGKEVGLNIRELFSPIEAHLGVIGWLLAWIAVAFFYCVPALLAGLATLLWLRLARLMWLTFASGIVVEFLAFLLGLRW